MELLYLKLIGSFVIMILALIIRKLSRLSMIRAAKKHLFQERRLAMTFKLVNFGLIIGIIIVLSLIWGVSHHQLILYLSSIFTVVGVALFAQWSLLSNITASVILFLNHPAKIGDNIQIIDKEFPITGKIKDIGSFFIIIETVDNEEITIPNNILFQKSIKLNCQLKKSETPEFEDE
jgi:small-conductance mechanosensitive channel